MQIVINISEQKYKAIIEKYDTFPAEWKEWGLNAIAKGTVLHPHGRLIDVERLYDDFELYDYDFEDAIEYAPTILEAWKGE